MTGYPDFYGCRHVLTNVNPIPFRYRSMDRRYDSSRSGREETSRFRRRTSRYLPPDRAGRAKENTSSSSDA